ncbi:unnamed protein product [Pleuronectes platessa]|uniref:Uncharacterized protein n=1 Tax=Pleuronectes platessa TaxID=8262 RepID=A0A9N7Y639_PLEPL|nr:unnamed protein product [Pleuronectes platessa]
MSRQSIHPFDQSGSQSLLTSFSLRTPHMVHSIRRRHPDSTIRPLLGKCSDFLFTDISLPPVTKTCYQATSSISPKKTSAFITLVLGMSHDGLSWTSALMQPRCGSDYQRAAMNR